MDYLNSLNCLRSFGGAVTVQIDRVQYDKIFESENFDINAANEYLPEWVKVTNVDDDLRFYNASNPEAYVTGDPQDAEELKALLNLAWQSFFPAEREEYLERLEKYAVKEE